MTHNGKKIEIVYTAFPPGAQGSVYGMTQEQTGRYIILIDNTRCRLLQYRALGHELAHIYLNHFRSNKPLAVKENEANAQAWHYYRSYRDGALAHETT